MTSLVIDPAKSHVRVETRAKGMLAKLAHDLSMEGRDPKGTCTLDGDAFAFSLDVPVSSLRVVGVRKGGRVDTSVLSSSDLADIHKKIRDDVLAGSSSITVAAKGTAAEGATDVAVELTVKAGRGEQRVRTRVALKREPGRTVATGMATLSLDALRIPPVKGPLGAFRVDDAVEVHAHLELVEG